MTFLQECAGLDVGIPVIRCASEASNYVFGIAIIIIFTLILITNLETENTKDRLATTLIATSLLAGFMALAGLLPSSIYSYTIILAILAAVAQYFTRNN